MEWKFLDGVDIYTEEFWYDLTDGGYIKPADILADPEQITKLSEAIDLVYSFEKAFDEKMEEGE